MCTESHGSRATKDASVICDVCVAWRDFPLYGTAFRNGLCNIEFVSIRMDLLGQLTLLPRVQRPGDCWYEWDAGKEDFLPRKPGVYQKYSTLISGFVLASAQLKSLDPPRRQHGELSLAARILPNGPKPRPWHSSSFAMEGWWTFMTLASAQLKTRDDQGKRRRNREGFLSHSLRAVWESIQPSLRFLGDAADLDIPDCQSLMMFVDRIKETVFSNYMWVCMPPVVSSGVLVIVS